MEDSRIIKVEAVFEGPTVGSAKRETLEIEVLNSITDPEIIDKIIEEEVKEWATNFFSIGFKILDEPTLGEYAG